MKKIFCLLIMFSLTFQTGCTRDSSKPRRYTIAFVPKLKGIPYFTACEKGAREAAEELGLELVYDGPTKADSNLQINLLKNRIASGEYDCFAVACTEKDRVSPTLKQAREKGIPVVTFDADAQPEARQFFVNMASYDGVAQGMVDALIEQLGPDPKGSIGIVTSSKEAPNQAEWAKRIKAYIQKWPNLTVLEEVVHGEDRDLGVEKTRALIQANKDRGLVGILGLTSVAVPAAAEAVRQERIKGKIVVTGVSTPSDMRDYIKDDTVKSFILWNPVDLGYLTVQVCELLRQGKMPENGVIQAGRLKDIQVNDREVLLGKPLKFTRQNIDEYDF